jgi:spore coat polysaccharide biosynthesis predicted glycosyltransferase SpsG
MHVDVVVGATNPRRYVIERMCSEMGAHYHCQIDYIAELMAKADVAVGAGGVAMWERCFLGLPSLVTVVADNQKASAEAVAAYGAIRLIGWHEYVTVEKYMEDIRWAIASPTALVHMSERAFQLMGTKNEQLHPLLRVILEG